MNFLEWLNDDADIKALPSAEAENIEEFKKNLSRTINAGIVATNTKDVYSCGMRNGMRWCRSLLEDEPPKFEDASVYVQPTVDSIQVVRCGECRYWDRFPSCSATPQYHACKRRIFGKVHTMRDDFCSQGERKDRDG